MRRNTMRIPSHVQACVFSIAVGFFGAASAPSQSPQLPTVSTTTSSAQMRDGKHWTTENLNVEIDGSYCHGDAEQNCRRYGRLYTWEAAQQGCRSLGEGWRLPTDEEWRQLAKHYGGVRGDADASGQAAYAALSTGGSSGFNAVLGGNRDAEGGKYARLDAHGFYWTATDVSASSALFYNFGKGGLALYRQPQGDKRMALSVRCVRD
jgi:uncharacterized protein (TIGR02145 family)